MESTSTQKVSLKVEVKALEKFQTQVTITDENTGHSVSMPAHRDLLFERVEEFFGNNLRIHLRALVEGMKKL